MFLIIIHYNARSDLLKTAELVVKLVIVTVCTVGEHLASCDNSDTVLDVNTEAMAILEH